MERFREFVGWLHFSVFVPKAILVFAPATGGKADTLKVVMATSSSLFFSLCFLG